jgi:SNF2 family DNA or RNA helicase
MNSKKEELNLTPVLVTIPNWLTKKKQLPMHFIGIIQRQTPKAYKIIGKGVQLKKAMGICSICGGELSNPNSIKLGIGPICAENMNIPTLSGYTDKDIEKHLHNIKIDDWFPLSYTKINADLTGINAPNFDDCIQKVSTYQSQEEYRKIDIKDGTIYIYFSFNKETLFNVKSLKGRKFNKSPKPHWTCPDTPQNRSSLVDFGFDLPPDVSPVSPENKDKVKKVRNGNDKCNGKRKCVPLHPPLPGHLDKVLMPFQKEGVDFIFKKHGRALIGDEMGLGKTLQALTYMEMKSEITVVVCPASLKLTWAREIAKWCTDYSITLCQGKKNKEKLKLVVNPKAKKDIYICNWDILGNKTKKDKGDKYPKDIPYTGWVDYLLDMEPDLVIGDEIHFAKNYKTIRARSFKRLGQRVKHLVCLSGTPIENRPVEFFPTLNLLNAGVFNNWYKYTQNYCGAQVSRFGRDVSGASNIDELHSLVSTVMIRRLKKDVLPQLPQKVRSVIPLELSNEKTYRRAYNDFINYLMETKGVKAADKAAKAEHLVKIENLKQLSYQGKKKAVIEWIKEYLETENKLVVFGVHKAVIQDLQGVFNDCSVVIDGNTPVNQRQDIADRFNNDPKINLFIGNIKAASEGLTLTASKATAFVEYWWSPGKQDQAEDRVHRIGQEADSVTAYYLAAKNSIDEDMLEMLDVKRKIVSGILDGGKEEEVSLVDIMYNRHKK